MLTETKCIENDTDEPSDSDLVLSAQSGNVNSFELLFRRYNEKIYLLCLRMTSRVALAEEHCQEAFIKAWQALPKFEGKSKFSTWVYRIAVNVVLAHQRKYPHEVFADLDWQQAFEDEFSSLHTPLQMDLEKAMSQLPVQAKNVLVMHDIVGMTHKEIGVELGIAAGTCKAHLSRARQLIRELLGDMKTP